MSEPFEKYMQKYLKYYIKSIFLILLQISCLQENLSFLRIKFDELQISIFLL